METKISVIIPVYNTEKFIAQCIESVQKQTLQDFEIIIVDDKTPDGSMEIVKSYANQDHRIRIIHHEINRGLMVARRTGYKAAQGDYIMFLDSDDSLPADALESLYRRMKSSDVDIVMAGYNQVDESGNFNRQFLPVCQGIFPSNEILRKLMRRELTHNLAFCLFRKTLFDGKFITYENQTNGEDLILFYQLVVKARRIDVCQHAVYNYTFNPVSSTKSPLTTRKIQQLVNVHSFKYDFLIGQGIDEKDIVRSINPTLVEWFYYSYGRKAIKQLPQAIQDSLKPGLVFKSLPALQATFVTITQIFPFLSPFLRKIRFGVFF